ncbi:enoyl-CoA hydratase/isomerase family protein [Nitriliruptoraceae bacterium ZYF776]|nr:enoyl-CoA hydratase/isomerase family protein [Profundirhabdus halotolerans]
MNALSPDVVAGFRDGLERARADDGVRVVVVTGTGRAFCAGADLKAIRGMSGDDPGRNTLAFLEEAGQIFDGLDEFPKPTIAAVNGLALAGGLELVLCCDLVIAAESAKLGDAHANYGLIPGGGGSIRLPRKVGPTMASYLLFTGEFLAAADLVACGLVNEVVADEQLTDRVDALAEVIASKSPLGLARMKQLVRDGLDQPIATGVRLELVASEAHAHSHDVAEGLAAFQEKRPPEFTGR